MREIRIATVQFEARDADKAYNLQRMDELAGQAAADGAELVVFHECCVPGYTFLENLSREEIEALAEPVPGGPSIEALRKIAGKHGLALGAGLVESDGDRLYNTYAVITADGVVAKHRKIHAFVSEHLACGDSYTVFDFLGCRFGILICYDCNLVENVRATALMGAEIVLAPHVTGCLPSPMPGRGVVEREVWENRKLDPVRCRQEFNGPKGRGWLMRWLPARAYENGVYLVYANPIGDDGGTIKPGGSLILDPFGEVLVECEKLGDEVIAASLDPKKIQVAPGQSYQRARRPDLYQSLLAPNPHLSPDGKPDVWWKRRGRK
ncbi:MAG: nitrilase family protein [Bryobacterales bacterium]